MYINRKMLWTNCRLSDAQTTTATATTYCLHDARILAQHLFSRNERAAASRLLQISHLPHFDFVCVTTTSVRCMAVAHVNKNCHVLVTIRFAAAVPRPFPPTTLYLNHYCTHCVNDIFTLLPKTLNHMFDVRSNSLDHTPLGE
mmetsp:Transcript_7337/g.11672  ORF Transcript_7337/g.11672 Transcript_7337/m.11672 type:complete len:143 (+) Transcript_7337:150-578(+)